MARRQMTSPERRCVLTGETKSTDQLIRLVEGPSGDFVPDVAGKLPGRGIWITADGPKLDAALDDQSLVKALARSVKKKVSRDQVPDTLTKLIEELLAKRALNRLGLEKAAGRIITGNEKVRAAIKDTKTPVALAFQARDGGDDGRSKFIGLTKAADVDLVMLFDREELSLALGRDNVVHAVMLAGGGLDQLKVDLVRLAGFRDEPKMKDKDEL